METTEQLSIVNQPSEMMPNRPAGTETDLPETHFIESNTLPITLAELSEKSIVPTFADNTLTISHQSFINSVLEAGENVFGQLTPADIRVSHQINGRVPSALHKKASELKESEKTVYFQRMGFIAHVEGLTRNINGQPIHLCIGGVRVYNEDKLFGRQSPMKFKFFVGWTVKVCTNLCLSCDGFTGNTDCMTSSDIKDKATQLFSGFAPKMEENLQLLENLGNTMISEEQFCKVIGRLRLYQALPTSIKSELELPDIILGDSLVNAAVRGYVDNPNFRKEPETDMISLWQMLQLLNEAAKLTYLDKWLERNQNCTDFCLGLQQTIEGINTDYSWFLN